ncbi:hypothetical protein SNEBB_010775 [Seison nebaliae]|nr:hypothetical protein SNEBB_010775 [Seison nebaliae]
MSEMIKLILNDVAQPETTLGKIDLAKLFEENDMKCGAVVHIYNETYDVKRYVLGVDEFQYFVRACLLCGPLTIEIRTIYPMSEMEKRLKLIESKVEELNSTLTTNVVKIDECDEPIIYTSDEESDDESESSDSSESSDEEIEDDEKENTIFVNSEITNKSNQERKSDIMDIMTTFTCGMVNRMLEKAKDVPEKESIHVVDLMRSSFEYLYAFMDDKVNWSTDLSSQIANVSNLVKCSTVQGCGGNDIVTDHMNQMNYLMDKLADVVDPPKSLNKEISNKYIEQLIKREKSEPEQTEMNEIKIPEIVRKRLPSVTYPDSDDESIETSVSLSIPSLESENDEKLENLLKEIEKKKMIRDEDNRQLVEDKEKEDREREFLQLRLREQKELARQRRMTEEEKNNSLEEDMMSLRDSLRDYPVFDLQNFPTMKTTTTDTNNSNVENGYKTECNQFLDLTKSFGISDDDSSSSSISTTDYEKVESVKSVGSMSNDEQNNYVVDFSNLKDNAILENENSTPVKEEEKLDIMEEKQDEISSSIESKSSYWEEMLKDMKHQKNTNSSIDYYWKTCSPIEEKLFHMGFIDVFRNRRLLRENNYDFTTTLDDLLNHRR